MHAKYGRFTVLSWAIRRCTVWLYMTIHVARSVSSWDWQLSVWANWLNSLSSLSSSSTSNKWPVFRRWTCHLPSVSTIFFFVYLFQNRTSLIMVKVFTFHLPSLIPANSAKALKETLSTRDAPIISNSWLSAVLPIIGIGRLVHWYRPIVVYTTVKQSFYYMVHPLSKSLCSKVGWVTISENFPGNGRCPPTDVGIKKLSPWTITWHCLHDHRFSHISRTPTCVRQMARQTDKETDTRWQQVPR